MFPEEEIILQGYVYFHSCQNAFNKILITFAKTVNKENYVQPLLAKSLNATRLDKHTCIGYRKNKIEMLDGHDGHQK